MKKDLTNKVFGKLTVISIHSRSRNGHIRWLCECECGKQHTVLSTHLLQGSITHCGCISKKGRNNKLWKGCGDISGNKWNQIVRGANGEKGRRGIELSITIEDAWNLFLKQNRKCALTGLEIWFSTVDTPGRSQTASLDRIDSSKGYIEGNIQWVHKDINKMKNSLDQNYFIEMCQLVATGGACEIL